MIKLIISNKKSKKIIIGDFGLDMAVLLCNWDKNYGPTRGGLSFDYYYSMAFAGLVKRDNPSQPMDEVVEFIPEGTTWSEINQIIVREINGSNKANGTKCN